MSAFTSDALLAEASAATGLSDFGDPAFRNGLERLLASAMSESRFSAGGEAGYRAGLVKRLVNRLQIEDWYNRHPEIEEEVIRDPVFNVGLPRTGSTALSHMLALDPDTRTLRAWEAARACPPPELATALTDPRIAENEARERAFDAAAPGVQEALPRNPSAPSECFTLLELSFASAAENAYARCTAFDRWVLTEDLDELYAAYRYHRRVLKLLQWRHPARRWVLRAPIHSYAMGPLLAAYPDARFIMTHREPAQVMPSICSLVAEVRKLFLQDRHVEELGSEWTRMLAMGQQRLMDMRARIGESRFIDVSHREQMADPIGTVQRLYAALGWPDDGSMARRIAVWREAHPKGVHRPRAQDFGIDPALVDELFSDYRRQFSAFL
jgi:hypothetical protein